MADLISKSKERVVVVLSHSNVVATRLTAWPKEQGKLLRRRLVHPTIVPGCDYLYHFSSETEHKHILKAFCIAGYVDIYASIESRNGITLSLAHTIISTHNWLRI